jgi:hypothetical protein
MRTSILSTALCVLLLAAGSPPKANAVQFAWGTQFEAELYQADGSTMDASFTFELGTFTSGFVPTEFNLQSWEANWKLLDRSPLDVPNQNVAAAFVIDTNGNSNSPDTDPNIVFAEGEQIYMWVFNTQAFNPGTSEWALISRTQPDPFASPTVFDWVIPDYEQSLDQDVNLNNADIVVFGGLHNVQGPGEYDAANQPSSFQLQTHVVPEPGSALLLGAIGLLARLRRSRKR